MESHSLIHKSSTTQHFKEYLFHQAPIKTQCQLPNTSLYVYGLTVYYKLFLSLVAVSYNTSHLNLNKNIKVIILKIIHWKLLVYL
jgi:hypothetical protein